MDEPLRAHADVSHYRIVAKIGAGGMGEVYLAEDTRLNRKVALKILPQALAADAERMLRFVQEAKTASALNHPSIITIHEIDAVAGTHFIATEFIEGDTLNQIIERGPMLLRPALAVAIQIVSALQAAHHAGIVHRDIKPENVMLRPDGLVKILDFGISKLAGNAAPVDADSATSVKGVTIAGMIVGTASYMSPEQARGEDVDGRSDLFSFGIVLYELLTGSRPFEGRNAVDVIGSILHKEPPPVRRLLPDAPFEIERIIGKILRKERNERYQLASDLLLDLKALLQRLELEVALERHPQDRPANAIEGREGTTPAPGVRSAEALARGGKPAPTFATSTAGPANSIAVMPFVNLSADKENEYFGDGLAEEIINDLTKVPELRVIARTSAFAFRGKQQDLRTIGERLGVETILEGSVRRAGNRIRVTAQLIQVADESHLWSERYDRELTDVFTVQDDISQAIAGALKVTLSTPQRRTVNVEAFQSYLKGLYWYQRYTAESLTRAKESFEQALTHDPGYAGAHAGLAVFYLGLGALSIRRMTEMAPLAQAAAQRALAIDPASSEAHSVLGVVTGAVDYDWDGAERHFRAAMAVAPVPPLVRLRYALYFLTPLGRFEEAFEQYQRALETDPLSMMVHYGLVFALYCQRHYDQAIEHAATALDLNPDYWLVHFALGLTLAQNGSLPQAITSLETTMRLFPSFTLAAGFLAAAYARSGQRHRAEALMEDVRERSSKQFVSPACFGVYHAALGQEDRMFELLRAALAERDPYLTRMDAEPYFVRFRSDARYRELLSRMNLG